jgi:NAD(P)-dependent dehydrogenase (short-subunit alcohol dehydrogenase family)
VLVNTIGTYHLGEALTATPEDLRLMIDVNVGAALWLTQAVVPYLRERGRPDAARHETGLSVRQNDIDPGFHGVPAGPSARVRSGSEPVEVGVVVVPERQHYLADDARTLDRPPVPAVA